MVGPGGSDLDPDRRVGDDTEREQPPTSTGPVGRVRLEDKRVINAQVDLATSELAAGKGENAVDAMQAAVSAAKDDADLKAKLTGLLVDAARGAATQPPAS